MLSLSMHEARAILSALLRRRAEQLAEPVGERLVVLRGDQYLVVLLDGQALALDHLLHLLTRGHDDLPFGIVVGRGLELRRIFLPYRRDAFGSGHERVDLFGGELLFRRGRHGFGHRGPAGQCRR